MTSPILALRAAILARCAGDAPLGALLGGSALVHDEPPPDAAPVYAVFGEAEARDASSSTERSHEQDLASGSGRGRAAPRPRSRRPSGWPSSSTMPT